jgi:hypothetical protein
MAWHSHELFVTSCVYLLCPVHIGPYGYAAAVRDAVQSICPLRASDLSSDGARFQIPPGQPFGADDIHVGLPLPEDRAQFGQDGIGLADDAQHVVCRRVRMQGRVS